MSEAHEERIDGGQRVWFHAAEIPVNRGKPADPFSPGLAGPAHEFLGET